MALVGNLRLWTVQEIVSSVLLCNRKSIQDETVRNVCENFQYLNMGIFVHILSGKIYLQMLLSSRIYIQMLFYCKEMEERIMGDSRFTITTIVENGYPHYKVHDNLTDNEIHCDLNELNETIWQLLEV